MDTVMFRHARLRDPEELLYSPDMTDAEFLEFKSKFSALKNAHGDYWFAYLNLYSSVPKGYTRIIILTCGQLSLTLSDDEDILLILEKWRYLDDLDRIAVFKFLENFQNFSWNSWEESYKGYYDSPEAYAQFLLHEFHAIELPDWVKIDWAMSVWNLKASGFIFCGTSPCYVFSV